MALALPWAGAPRAQPVNNDYFASRGTELLRTVEQYHLGPGEQRMRDRLYGSAFHDFKFILNYFPNHPQVLLLMAQLCAQWKAPQCNADEFYVRGVARNPSAAPVLISYGVFLLRAGRTGPAIEQLKAALASEPDSMNAHYNIGLAYLEERKYALANEHAQKAYALGAPVPGLRNRLERAGHWKPVDPGQGTPAAASGSPPSAPR